MKRKRIASTVVLVIFFAAVSAWPHGGHEHGKQGEEVRHHDLRGTLGAIDPAQKTFELKQKDRTVICFFDEKTRITRDGKDIPFSALKAGDTVTCRCAAEKEGRHYSQRIWLRSR